MAACPMRSSAIAPGLSPLLSIHSLVMGISGEDAVANHRAYAGRMGYRHLVHQLGLGEETDRTRLLRKYSKMLGLLREVDERQILVFVEDSVAFSQPLAAHDVLGQAPFWLCQDGHWRERGNGGLIILRGGPEGIALVETILERCQALDAASGRFSRWEHNELAGLQTHMHHGLIQGCYPNLLFPSFGHAMPGISAYAVSFNPHVLPHVQDHHANIMVIRHLTRCLREDASAFEFAPLSCDNALDNRALSGRHSRVRLMVIVQPEQEGVAGLVEENLFLYARSQGYALEVRREALGHDRLTAMLHIAGEQISHYEFTLCCTADILIHDLRQPIPPLFAGASLLLARAPWGGGPDSGLVGVRNDEAGKALIAAARGDRMAENASISELLDRAIDRGDARLADLISLAPHGAFRDPGNFLIRYHALPENLRELVMREDAAMLPDQLLPPAKAPPVRTSLSSLRHPRLNRIIMAIVATAALIAAVQQFR